MYIMPQHLQWYDLTAQGDICLCEIIVSVAKKEYGRHCNYIYTVVHI